MNDLPESVDVKQWVKRGGMLFNAEYLEPDDPMHLYNQIKAMGLPPEEYGVDDPNAMLYASFDNKTRKELIDIIIGLEKELEAIKRAGF